MIDYSGLNRSDLNNNDWYLCMKKNMKVSSGYCENCDYCESHGIIIKPLKEISPESYPDGEFK